jgi:hypothetical protein
MAPGGAFDRLSPGDNQSSCRAPEWFRSVLPADFPARVRFSPGDGLALGVMLLSPGRYRNSLEV